MFFWFSYFESLLDLNKFYSIIVVCTILLFGSNQVVADVQVIAHPSVNIDSLSQRDLSRIYVNQMKFWSDQNRLTVFSHSTKSPILREFSVAKLRMQPHQLSRVWKRLTFSGTGRAPVMVKTEKEMLQKIISTPGSIGYVLDTVNVDNVSLKKIDIQQ